MSKLAPSVRKTIDAGTAVLAICEEIHLGLATVRLADGGARLTNLVASSSLIQPGDSVVVDYAAGTTPVVRPLTVISEQVQSLPEATPISEQVSPQPSTSCKLNLLCFDRQWESGYPKLPLVEDVPTLYPFNQDFWDPADLHYYQSAQVVIKEAGIYLVRFNIIEPINATHIWVINPTFQLPVKEQHGAYRVRLLRNGEPLLEAHYRVFEDNDENVTALSGTVFDHLDSGDVLELEITLEGWYFIHYSSKYFYDVCYGYVGILSTEGELNSHVLNVELVVPMDLFKTKASKPAYSSGKNTAKSSLKAYLAGG